MPIKIEMYFAGCFLTPWPALCQEIIEQKFRLYNTQDTIFDLLMAGF